MNVKGIAVALLAAAGVFSSAVLGAENQAVSGPVKSVLDHYISIETQLAGDSMKGVSDDAKAIATAVNEDESKSLPPALSKQASKLASANDLKTARAAFKPLSASLVKYLAATKTGKGTYHEVYCPMAKANWVQKGTDVKNPYMGKEMLDCGVVRD
jgi:hypothetical protein